MGKEENIGVIYVLNRTHSKLLSRWNFVWWLKRYTGYQQWQFVGVKNGQVIVGMGDGVIQYVLCF